MQIDFKGASCVVVKDGQTSLVFDDNLKELGGRSAMSKADVVCWTQAPEESGSGEARLWIDCPGRYEIGDFVLNGWPAQSHHHGSDQDAEPVTIYQGRAVKTGVSFAVIGNIAPQLDDYQVANIAPVDVLVLPVGGKCPDNCQTLDAEAAAAIVRQLSPGLVVPINYSGSGAGLRLPQPLAPVTDFVKASGLPSETVVGNLRVKKKDIGDTPVIKVISQKS